MVDIVEHRGRLERRWSRRNSKIREWYDLRDLRDHMTTTGLESAVSNDPKAQLQLARHFLADGPEIFSIPIVKDREQREKASQAERFLWGQVHANDDLQHAVGKSNWRYEQSDFMLMTGHYYTLSCVVPGEDGKPIFLSENWEPWTCYPEPGERGLKRFVHVYEQDIAAALEQGENSGWHGFIVDAEKEAVTITDYYEKEHLGKGKYRIMHGILVDDKVVQELDEVPIKGLEDIPIRWGVVGGYASHPDGGQVIETKGQSFLEANRKTWIDRDRWLSHLLQGVRMSLFAPIIVETSKQIVVLTKEMLMSGKSPILHMAKGETIRSAQLVSAPPGLEIIKAHFDIETQLGGLSRALTGMLPSTDVSGYLYNSLRASALSILGPFEDAINSLRGRICMDWLLQFREGKYKDIKVVSPSSERVAGYMVEDFARKNVPDYVFVKVTKPLAIPRNLVQQAAIFRQLMPGPIPGMSLKRAMSDILEIQDVDLEQEMIMEDLFRQSPENKALEFIAAAHTQADYWESRDPKRAEVLRQIAGKLTESMAFKGEGAAPRGGIPAEVLSTPERPEREPSGVQRRRPGSEVETAMSRVGLTTPRRR